MKKQFSLRNCFSAFLTLSVFFFTQAVAQISPEEASVTPSEFQLDFLAPTGSPLANFSLESNDTLLAENWQAEPTAVFTNPTPGNFRVTLSRAVGETKNFYRVMGVENFG